MLTLGEYKALETAKLCLGRSLILDMKDFSRRKANRWLILESLSIHIFEEELGS